MSTSQESFQNKRKLYWSISFIFNLMAVFSGYIGISFWVRIAPQANAPAAIMEASQTLSSFNPILGLGITIGFLILFMTLATFFGGMAES